MNDNGGPRKFNPSLQLTDDEAWVLYQALDLLDKDYHQRGLKHTLVSRGGRPVDMLALIVAIRTKLSSHYNPTPRYAALDPGHYKESRPCPTSKTV